MKMTYPMAAILRDVLAVVLLLTGVALIAVGLWCIWYPVALLFCGAVLVYVARCVNMTAKYPERTDKK